MLRDKSVSLRCGRGAIDPDAKAIAVFTLTKGAYQLHFKATGNAPAKSKLLAGFKTNFIELTA
jgi:hypothetical protein